MAGSRVERVGTILTRITGLLRSGALRGEDKPLWYDVYRAFPPKQEPRHGRPIVMRDIPNIFYREDVIRAQFYKQFPNASIDAASEQSTPLSERFIKKYYTVEAEQKHLTSAEVFQATATAFNLVPSSSVRERRQDVENMTPVGRSTSSTREDLPGQKFKVADLLKSVKE